MRVTCPVLALGLYLASLLQAQQSDLTLRTPESEAARLQLEKRVTLDIQVTDAVGQPIHALIQSDFTFTDNGKRKALTSFQEIDGHASHPPVEAILVLDTMNASFETAGIMRQEIEAFLRQNDGRLAIPVTIVFLTDTGVKLSKPSTDGLELAKGLHRLPAPIHMLNSAQGANGDMDRFQRSLTALQRLSSYEASRPGRKLLVWTGPGWPLLEARTAAPEPKDAHRYYASIVAVTTLLRRAHVTLYSVAPVNLSHGDPMSSFLYQDFVKGVSVPEQANSPNLGVQVLALHSGGLVLNRGSMASQIDRCLADAGSFYEVTFDADPGDPRGIYRALEIAVDRPASAARTGTAYYAGPPQFTGGANTSTGTVPLPAEHKP